MGGCVGLGDLCFDARFKLGDMVYGVDFTVEPLRLSGGFNGHRSKNPCGRRGPDRKPRRMNPNSLRNGDEIWRLKRNNI